MVQLLFKGNTYVTKHIYPEACTLVCSST
uniref:Uncharacterized protein n=1 Tax=Arundo donax TaxID=35708 RepID=A0A0A9A916_ARUDO